MTAHVAFAADAAMFRYCANLLRSVHTNASEEVIFHAFVDFEPAQAEAALRAALPELEICFHRIDAEALRGLAFKEYISHMSFARLLMPGEIPTDRFVYFDIDILVTGDVAELLQTDLGDNVIGGVFHDDGFNAGVLLIDGARWNAEELTGTMLEYARVHRPREADQDTLRAVLDGRILHLDPRWNMVVNPFWQIPAAYAQDRIQQARALHFITGFKPWNLGRYFLPRYLRELWQGHDARLGLPADWRQEARILRWQAYMLLKRLLRRT